MRLGQKLLIVPLATAAILAGSRADAGVAYLGASQDTWVDSGSWFATHGADTSLSAMTGFLTTRTPALQFDLSTIDSSSTVVSAVLMMVVTDPDSSGMPVLINRITGPWNEGTANYLSLSLLTNSASWGSMIAGGYGIATADVTALVQAWVKQTLPNYGLALKATAPAGESIRFSSSNASYPSSRPVLLVNTVEAKPGMRVQTGFYIGDDNSSHAITGIGFTPSVVIVKGDGTDAIVKTNTMPGNKSKSLGSTASTFSGRIESLDSDGFTVSNNSEVNALSARYDWIAFGDAPGYMTTGSYTGNGADDRNLTGLGFQPDYLMVLSEDGARAVQRFPSQIGDASHTFANTPAIANAIQAFLANGFQVGNSPETNTGGTLHHFVAWNTSPGTINGSTYTGNGATPRAVTGAGFQPDVVILKRDQDSEAGVFRSSSWSGDTTATFLGSSHFADGIKSMQADGFQVGAAATVNMIAKTYQWVAFRDAATPPQSDLDLTVNASNLSPTPGETIALAVSLTNKGPMIATSVQVTNVLPSGLAYVSNVATRGTFAPATGVWSIGPLANGEQVNLTINAQVDWSAGGKRLVDFASVTGLDQADSLATNNTDSVAVNVVNPALRILNGSYVGNGTIQTISGLGFQPSLVIVRGDNTQGTMARTSTMPAGLSKELGIANVLTAGAISALTADGFSVGSAASVNSAGVTYHWSAFEAAPYALSVGSYVGNGADDRSITGVGFMPGYLMVMSANNETSMQRFEAQAGDASLSFEADGVRTDRIQAFETDGFQVGGHNTVNQSGQTIHYVAFNTAHPNIATGVYIGDNQWVRDIVAGFSPAQVWIRRGDVTSHTAERFGTVVGDKTFPVPAGSSKTRSIASMLPDGFRIGDEIWVNSPNKIFYWTAFRSTANADVGLSMTVDNPDPTIGTLVQFSLFATNNGPAAVTGLSIIDLLPAGLQLVSATASQGSYDSTSGDWTVGDVPFAATATLVLTARVAPGTGGTMITHSATVSNASSQPDPDPANDRAEATVTVRIVDLSITATADRPVVVEGDTIRWRVDVTSAGPDSATGVSIADTIPVGVVYSGYSATTGTWSPATGIWTIGSMATGETHALTITTLAGNGTAGSTLFNRAWATAAFPEDADSSDNQGVASVSVAFAVALIDEPLSLYPASAFVGDPQLSLRIGLNNTTTVGVVLDTTSTIRFSDGIATYQAQLANVTAIPPGASDFTIRFRASAVPAAMKIDTTLALTLTLDGSTTAGAPYAQTIATTGRNAIAITGPKVRIDTVLIGDRAVYPGANGVAVLAFDVVNGYTSARSLDTLVVSNGSSGPGSALDLDVSVRRISLYADSDADEALSAADVFLGQASFSGGRAFLSGSGWSVPAASARSLLVVYDVDSLRCRDSDLLDAVIASGSDIRFLQPTTLDGNITPLSPVNSYGVATVDGMVAFQASVSALSDTLFSGDLNRVVATVVLPKNGYENDVLTALRLRDDSGNFSAGDFARLRFFRDNGDGIFSATADTVIGTFGFSGNRYEVSGLASVLTGPTTFFAVADVAATPVSGHTFRPGIPVGGIEVASGNDGPIDAALNAAGTHPIVLREQIDVVSLALTPASATPGAAGVPALWLRLQNSTPSPVSLDSLRINNLTSGSGSPAEIDALVRNVSLYRDNGNGVIDFGDVLLASGQGFAAGLLTTPAGVTLLPGTPVHLLVACDVDSFCAADGDTLLVGVAAGSALRFSSPQTVAGKFPMRTSPGRPVDGMVAHEIGLIATADSLIITAPTGNLVFEFYLRGNGYRADTLTTLALVNQGSATSEHIAKLSLYVDGGNGTWEDGGGDDVALGDFTLVGLKQYSLTLPGVALAAGCGNSMRFFVTADLTPSPTTGGTIQLQVPVMGVAMGSGNDGPIDVPATNPSTILIPKPNVLTVFPYSVGQKRVLPGSTSTLNFGVGFYNGLATPLTLSAMDLFQQGTALSSEIVAVKAYADTDSNGLFSPTLDQLLSSASSATSFYALNNINQVLAPRKISYVFVAYDLPTSVRDSVGINLQLNSDTDLTFSATNVTVQGEFPINSPGVDFTDGMVAAQIPLNPAPQYRAAPTEQNVLAMGLTIPPNGFLTDALRFVSVRNTGSAVAGTDIAAMNLWADNGDGVFSASQDRLLTGLTWLGSAWRNPVAISEGIPTRGLACFVTANIAASAGDNRTIQLHVPVNGVSVASGNDGPLDGVVTNPNVQTISTDPLLTGIAFDRASYTVGQAIVVTMTVRNAGPIPLLGIAGSNPATSGTGAATLISGPTPAMVDLSPGSDTTIVWTFTAAAAGDFSVCGNAATADSAEISVVTCTPVVAIENRALDVTATMTDVSPTGVNRGQSNVGVIRVTLAYTGYDTLSADVRVNAVSLGLSDATLAPIAPNSRLSGATLISSSGSNYAFSLVDSLSSPVRLALSTPAMLLPGQSMTIDITCNVATAAVLAPFRVDMASLGSLEVVDANDGVAAPVSSSQSFPWRTNLIDVTDRADSLLAASLDTSWTTINVAQNDITAMRLAVLNNGSPVVADELVTRLTFSFYDSTGVAIAPGDAIRKLSIHEGTTTLYLTESIPSTGNTMQCALTSALLLSPQTPRDVYVRVDARAFPAVSTFYLQVTGPLDIDARDNNSGDAVAVSTMAPSLSFPLRSRVFRFQQPATGLLASGRNLAPATILPGQISIPLMEVALSHPDPSGASPVRVDSLTFEFVDAAGAPAFPGNFFSQLWVVSGPDTLAQIPTLSSFSPLVGTRLSTPLTLAPGESDSLRAIVDARTLFSPGIFRTRVQKDHIVAVDVNTGQRVLGIAGAFPLQSDLYALSLAGSAIHCALQSLFPANVSGRELGIEAMDLIVENRATPGYTPAELRMVDLRVQSASGSGVAANTVVAAARIYVADTLLTSAVVTPGGIRFTISAGAVTLPAGSSKSLRVALDLNAIVQNTAFRLALIDTSSSSFVDVATGAGVTAGIAPAAYPLATQVTHVLGGGAEAGFTNYPNPFPAGRQPTRVTFFLSEDARVTLRVFTLWGAPVATLLRGEPRLAGLHQDVLWTGQNGDGDVINNGVYYMVLEIAPDNGGMTSLRRKVGVLR